MPKEDYNTAPMVLLRYTEGFEKVDYAIPLNGPFDVTTPLTAIQLEALAKNCGVFVQVALIPLEEFWGPQEDETEGETDDE